MTILEVLNEITKEHKWYVGKLKQQTASELHRRIRLGKAKPETIRKFFNTFGYLGEYNFWEKVTLDSSKWEVKDNAGNEYKATALKGGNVFLVMVDDCPIPHEYYNNKAS